MLFKLVALFSVFVSLAGIVVSTPLPVNLTSRRHGHNGSAPAPGSTGNVAAASAAPANVVPCTNTDQSAAAFSDPDEPDVNLPTCSDIAPPSVAFPCTNIDAVATAFNVPLCTNTDQSAAAFSDPDEPDVNLPSCSDIAPPSVAFPCTNIDAVAAAFNLPLNRLRTQRSGRASGISIS
ncbi:hypothetical protein GGX14DRAFT_396613 [Mycena pura]|uniref:Hydrophobin n=1 Tax=Mycena pura TaxID=153505 RepID=A0AAD6VE71_9AGAR|nr:hypothetical protein GGX14DRAFT_396613 [Mycena pura]